MPITTRLSLLAGVTFASLTAADALAAKPRPHALPAAEALASFRLEPGLKIELVAMEPLVVDPVAFAFDEQRRLYVVENRGYPDPIGGTVDGAPPRKQGKIVLLKDTNGDGQLDRRVEFATDLSYPNGILPWRGGVFVTCSPDIYYLKDTDGDGVADVRRVVLTGFDAKSTSQIRMSHPTLGLDGWVYVTSGLAGGKVRSPEHAERPEVSFSPADGRFHPDTFEFQTTGGRGQFGMTMDSYGRRFVTSNRHPLMHVVLEPWHLRRNPHLVFADTMQHVSKVDAEAIVFPISQAVVTASFIPSLMSKGHVGTFTSACSAVIFNGTGLTEAHRNTLFVCEPAQNLVQRQLLEPQGASFRSELPYRDKEFLASTDEWFRPVFLGEGPDGALYLADMHRAVIDHPQYIPEESRGLFDFVSGGGEGRIYRIVRDGFSPQFGAIKHEATPETLLKALESEEEWERRMAHRLLLERKDAIAAPALAKILAESRRPEARVLALWLLQDLGRLTPTLVRIGLVDDEAGVREQAVLLAGRIYLADPSLADDVARCARDANPRVRLHSALTLGSIGGSAAVSALAEIAMLDGDDRWTRAAVLSGIGERMSLFMDELRTRASRNPEAFAAVMQDLGRLFGAGASVEACRSLAMDIFGTTAGGAWQMTTLLGLVQGLAGRKEMKATEGPLLAAMLGASASPAEKTLLETFIAATSRTAGDETAPLRLRTVATALLGFADYSQAGTRLADLLSPQQPADVQIEAVQALSRIGDLHGVAQLVEPRVWSRYTPRIREAAIAALLSKPAFTHLLFDAIEQNRIAPAELSSNRRNRLLSHNDEAIKRRAGTLFKNLEGGDRMQVYRDYKSVLTGSHDPAKGREPYMRACSACHTFRGAGGQVGPDLGGLRNQPAEALLLHIIVPNYEVMPMYQAITVETRDGRVVSGWLVSETDNSLTLRTAFGTEESVLRQNVASLSASGLSLMPDGLEQTMTRDEMGALIAYLKSTE